MPVSSLNLIQGPAVLYRAPFGTTEPATVATTPATPWLDYGGTKDGVTLSVSDTYSPLSVDQIIYEVGQRRIGRMVDITTVLAEATLANFADAINNSAPVSNVLTADDGLAAFSPNYLALIMDGIAPGGFRRRVTLRRVQSVDAVGVPYKKDAQTVVPVKFKAFWVSSSIPPFKIEDATA